LVYIQKPDINDPKLLFDPTLFWDVEIIDIDRHADYVIARVLNFGDEKGLKNLRELYSDDRLISVIKNRRALLPITPRFCSVYFNVITLDESDV